MIKPNNNQQLNMAMMRDYNGRVLRRAGRLLLGVVVAAGWSSTSQAFAPPHPNHTSYESASMYRRKHGITFQYQPTNIHPEVCKYMSEEECRHADESMKIQHETHRQNQRLLETNPNVELNILVLLMQFTDHADRKLPEPYEYQLLLNLRVAEYFKVNSYETYRVWFDVIPWQMTDLTEYEYSFEKSGRTLQLQKSFHPLLDALYDDPNMDFGKYDANGDGVLDNLIVLHSGYPAEVGGEDCTNSRGEIHRIWSHALASASDYNWVSQDGAMKTNGYTVASALFGKCDSLPAETGVITHEYFHSMADIIDLYDTAEDPDTGEPLNRGKGGLGTYDIMSNPYGTDHKFEDFPSHLSAWTKTKLGWATPILLNTQTELEATYTLRPSELYPDFYQVNLENFFGNEFLLLENRQKKLFDIKFFGEGLVIYHVDDAIGGQQDRGYPGMEGWPDNGLHYRVAVVQADGKYDMEKLENRGDENDFWKPGMSLMPGDGQTFPNTDTYGAYLGVFPSGVEIKVLEQIGDDIVISVTIPPELMGAPPKETDAAFAAPTKDQFGGKFRADWFDEDAQGLDAAPGQDEDQDVWTGSGSVSAQDAGIGFVSNRPPDDTDGAAPAGVETTESPSTAAEGESTEPTGAPSAAVQGESTEPTEGPSPAMAGESTEPEQGEPADEGEGDSDSTTDSSGTTDEEVVTVVTSDDGQGATGDSSTTGAPSATEGGNLPVEGGDANEEPVVLDPAPTVDAFSTPEKYPFIAPEQTNATDAQTGAVDGSPNYGVGSIDMGVNASIVTDSFTNTSGGGVDAEESGAETEGYIVPDNGTNPPSQEDIMGESFIAVLGGDSAATRAMAPHLWGIASILPLLVLWVLGS